MNVRMNLAKLIVLTALVPGAALAADPVEVTGEAAIVAGDEPAAKEKARDAALRLAVEMVAGTMVTGISESKDFISLRDEITSQSTGYVERFKILEEKCDKESGVCTSRIKAWVAKESLRNKLTRLGLLSQKRGYPRVIILVSEALPGKDAAGWWTGGGGRTQIFENEFIEYVNKVPDPERVFTLSTGKKQRCSARRFAANAFVHETQKCWQDLAPGLRVRFVDYTSLRSNPVVKAAMGDAQVDNELAAKIAGEAGAEIAIVGQALVREGSTAFLRQTSDSHWFLATASLRAIDAKTGAVLASTSVQDRLPPMGKQYHHGRAEDLLRGLARLAALEFREALADALDRENRSGRFLTLEITGIDSYRDLQRIKRFLKEGVRGVSAVMERGLDGKKATLEVRATASSQDIALFLESKGLLARTVRITKVNEGLVALQLK